MATNNRTTTFWRFIENHSIEMPIIQRDYAQGRSGKENLRKNFLTDLKKALDNDSPYENTTMKLDFVYGSTENGKLYPLDGQQRLTTLWLLHWYIALRAGKLKEASNHLIKFSYETRVSSRDFCEKLCEPKNFENYNCGNDIVEFITNQTWFYSAWKQDPTIQSMLRMLGGSKGKNDLSDGIEKVFGCCCNCISNKENKFEHYYTLLTGEDCPIVFYYLPKDFGNSDDLYIKMNARGEQLTSFENFKADLIGYITKQSEDEKDEDRRAEWNNLLDPKGGIPIKLDTDWTNIFWKHKSKYYKIDDIYFAFLNRFFLNELICLKDETEKEGEITEFKYKFTADYLEKENKSFNYLYGDKGDDSELQYNDLGIYQYFSDGIPFQLFDSLQKTLNKYSKLKNDLDKPINDYFPKWVDSKFEFIPQYHNEEITILGQKERIMFLAVCRYLEKCSDDFDVKRFEQWLRVVWNIVENSGIETISAMIGAMRLINELSEKCDNIYDALANHFADFQLGSQYYAQDQVQEEIMKAKKIQESMTASIAEEDETSWCKAIVEAEKYRYLKGKIRVLFQDDDSTTLETFKARHSLLCSLIDGNEGKEDKYYLVKVLLSRYGCDKPKEKIVLKRSHVNWKKLITEDLSQCFKTTESKSIVDSDVKYLKYLTKTNLLNERSKEVELNLKSYGEKVVLFGRSSATWHSYDNVILDEMHCDNQILQNYKSSWSIKIDNNKYVFIGEHIDFQDGYANKFRWHTNGYIYLMVEQDKYCHRPNPKQIKDRAVKEEYYCFKADDCNNDSTEFANHLSSLISQKNDDEKKLFLS